MAIKIKMHDRWRLQPAADLPDYYERYVGSLRTSKRIYKTRDKALANRVHAMGAWAWEAGVSTDWVEAVPALAFSERFRSRFARALRAELKSTPDHQGLVTLLCLGGIFTLVAAVTGVLAISVFGLAVTVEGVLLTCAFPTLTIGGAALSLLGGTVWNLDPAQEQLFEPDNLLSTLGQPV